MSRQENGKPPAIGLLCILFISAAACTALHVAIWWFCGWEWLLTFLAVCIVSNFVIFCSSLAASIHPPTTKSEAQ